MKTRTETADHLDKAADLLMMRGHVRGAWSGVGGGLCANAALIAAVNEEAPFDKLSAETVAPEATTALAAHLKYSGLLNGASFPRPVSAIIYANDDVNADMEEQMRLCAKALRESEGKSSQRSRETPVLSASAGKDMHRD